MALRQRWHHNPCSIWAKIALFLLLPRDRIAEDRPRSPGALLPAAPGQFAAASIQNHRTENGAERALGIQVVFFLFPLLLFHRLCIHLIAAIAVDDGCNEGARRMQRPIAVFQVCSSFCGGSPYPTVVRVAKKSGNFGIVLLR